MSEDSRRRRKASATPPVGDSEIEFLNRDLQWLEFNARVLHEAEDPRTPLLERLRFLSIFDANLDEFFMKRMGTLKQNAQMGIKKKGSAFGPAELIEKIRVRVRELMLRQVNVYTIDLLPNLRSNGVFLLRWEELSLPEKQFAEDFFRRNIFPVLTPLAVDPGIPFPFISNLSTSLAVALRDPNGGERLFARIKVPSVLPQWILLKSESEAKSFRYVSLVETIHHNLFGLFPDMEILGVMPFRITRDIEVERDEEEADDLLQMVAEELKQRRFGDLVRLEHGLNPDPWILGLLREELEVSDELIYERPALLNFGILRLVADVDLPDLRYPTTSPLVPPRLLNEGQSFFDVLGREDLLVHHPFESFAQSVERFIKQAVEDRNVLAIKMTLYRTGDDSPFVPLLIRAAEMGKQVVVLIELKARFDEERNIHWAQELENAGVHVVYGVIGFKTHSKTTLIVRQESSGLKCYAHIGTGNYHRTTAKLYTDFGLFTAKTEFTEDVVEIFHFLTGRSLKRKYNKLLMAPFNLRDRLLELIRGEIDCVQKGGTGRIIIKCNAFEEASLSKALYEASQAGVSVTLIVRGFCTLRPQVPGLSDKIQVISVIGRFLEHSRAFYFSNGQADYTKGYFFIGSADIMYRNLSARVETVVPIEDTALKERIWEVFDLILKDRRSAWVMQPDGSYRQLIPANETEKLGSQEMLLQATRSRHQRILTEIDRPNVEPTST